MLVFESKDYKRQVSTKIFTLQEKVARLFTFCSYCYVTDCPRVQSIVTKEADYRAMQTRWKTIATILKAIRRTQRWDYVLAVVPLPLIIWLLSFMFIFDYSTNPRTFCVTSLYVVVVSRSVDNFVWRRLSLNSLPRKKHGIFFHLRPSISLFLNTITKKLLDIFWWNLASWQIMTLERTHYIFGHDPDLIYGRNTFSF